jgi:hypothetical protein
MQQDGRRQTVGCCDKLASPLQPDLVLDVARAFLT